MGDRNEDRAVREPTAELQGRVGKYDIVKFLGKGAMGAVYHAHDSFLERDVALKVMLPQIADDPEHKLRFEREARAVARMMHPNVVTVFDLGYHTDGSPYIVMELLKGHDLLNVMRQRPQPSLSAKISIILQVLEGLGHAHKVGIVHRDIKPANIFLKEDGTAKIMDFGVARVTSTSMTSTGVVVGTANYMSPEQVLGGRLDGRSDIFSVGCMLCELVTGRRPFDAENIMSTLYRIAHDKPELAIPAGSEHEGLRPILAKALSRNAEERYTAAEFAVALRLFQGSHGLTSAAAPAETVSLPPLFDAPDMPAATSNLGGPLLQTPPTISLTKEASRPPDVSGLFRLMREIYVGSKSGHLHFAHDRGRERRSLRIVKGQIVHGTSDVEGEHLGDVLVRYGLLSQANLDRAIAIVLRERKRLGAVLSDLGLLERGRLEEAVGMHVREILFNVLSRADGTQAFEELSDSAVEAELVSQLSTGEVILEATRRVQDPALVRQGLGDMNRILILSRDPLLRSQRITLTPTDGFILSRIDGTLSAREVVSLIPLPPEDTERSLFGLVCTGTVDYLPTAPPTSPAAPTRTPARREGATGPPTPPPAAARPAAPMAPPTPPPPTAKTPSEEVRRVEGRQPEEIRKIVLEVYEGLRQKDYFEVLGVSRTANETQIREAYGQFARLLHPDACRDPSLADIREKREAVFFRLSEAYETLRDPLTRSKYEAAFDARRPRLAPAPPAPVAPAAAAPAPAAPSPPPPPPAPDPPPTIDPVMELEASMDSIRQAERLLKEEKFWDAIQLLESAIRRVEGAPRVRAKVALAQAYMKNPKWLKRAEEVLQGALRENPAYVDAYVVLGSIYRASGLVGRAAATYRKALELHPGHPKAVQALASLEGPGGQKGRLSKKA
ncbi:MAG TPA: protein kinase [Vicinamibacteria bacterium]|nr:protein kinase [Vicinamibacteria bacterium]